MNVSIVIATYGDDSWRDLALKRALPSCEALDTPPHEVRLVHRATLNDARNAGALAATGEWLCFLDADDELEAGYLGAMRAAEPEPIERLATPDEVTAGCELGIAFDPACALLIPAVRYLDRRGQPQGEAHIPNAEPPRSLIEVNRAVIGTLIPRALFLDVGGFGDEPIYEDWSLWLRCVRAGAELVHVPRAVYRAHRRPRSRNTFRGDATAWYWRIRNEHEGTVPALTTGRLDPCPSR